MQSNTVYAPVIVPTLNRYYHLQRLISSLLANKEASETELVIGLDYPPSEKYEDGWLKIKQYLPTIGGFKKITILEADKNLGVGLNLRALKQYVWNQGYDRFIISEDDNEFSPNFLSYMNWALEKFKNDERIMAISAYNYPVDMSFYNKDYYYSHFFSAWGYGQTKKQNEYNGDQAFKRKYLLKIIKNPLNLYKIWYNVGWRMVLDIFMQYKKKKVYGDCFITYYQLIENKFCVFPKVSKVKNWGHDGSGLHSGASESEANLFHHQQMDNANTFVTSDEVDVGCNKEINKRLKKFFHKDKFPFADRFKKLIK